MHESDEKRFDDSISELDFSVGLNCLVLFRSITDKISTGLSLAVMRSMLVDHDFVTLMVLLLEMAPWIRESRSGYEVFNAMGWKRIKKEDLNIVTKLEAQVWLSVMNLLLEKDSRQMYQYSSKKKATVMKLKDWMSEETVDQIPPLTDLQRYIEELSMMIPPDNEQPSVSIQMVSSIRDDILLQVNATTVSSQEKLLLNSDSSLKAMSQERIMKSLIEVYNRSELDQEQMCASCGDVATQRCSICKDQWYCSRPCQVKDWKIHKGVCESITSGSL